MLPKATRQWRKGGFLAEVCFILEGELNLLDYISERNCISSR